MNELIIPRGPDPHSFPEGVCGCGAETTLYRGRRKRFLHGHSGRCKPRRVRYTEDRDTGCWLWVGYLRKDGYANLFLGDEVYLAHRYIYNKLVGDVPDGMELDHLCRVRHCINPAHLEPVTHLENVRRGTRTVLTPDAVAEIRRVYGERGGRYGTIRRLAREYGVTPSTVAAVVKGKRWVDTRQTA